ncbi:Flagellar M-ring protein FliF [hydrothermal vent metagenome]|uniref:Flagellar M-ring protein FliF n=1 Tax=hydrothermal vent metagenome TaxID=652676 RepID=A0A3B1AIW7_9ZZZZ
MASANPETTELAYPVPQGLMANPAVRQLLALITLAASIALGIVIAMWAWTPNYTMLYGSLAEKDASEVVDALQQGGIEFKVDQATGGVMVPSSAVQEARLKLAGQGLPRGNGLGFELLQQETGFGTSRLVEAARYQRAMEGELARTISTISSVQTARVHLAVPKQSVFVRKRKKTSASVVVKLYPGRILEKGQVASIVYLVSSSVPELEAGGVTVVDHKGTLLSGQSDTREMMLSTSQFNYTKQLEEHYKYRIEDILTPILGAASVRAQVTAEVDFTLVEKTEEAFNPKGADKGATLRSEQIQEERSRLSGAQGVPGALSNQPPAGGVAPEKAGPYQSADASGTPINTSTQATRNYEVDKTISHTRLPTTSLRRLSVAVVVDNPAGDAKGNTVKQGGNAGERTPEELERITELVKQAMGFSEARGDTVSIINAPFQLPPEPAALPEEAIWEKAWVWDLGRQIGGAILVLTMIFVVLKPAMKKLMTVPAGMAMSMDGRQLALAGGHVGAEVDEVDEYGEPVKLPGPGEYERTLDAARGMVQKDPKRVAQVVKKWVAEDAG